MDDGQRPLLLFVYGTLMRGESNHALLGDARCLGDRSTTPDYALVDLDEYPGLVRGDGAVVGELYRIDEARIPELDAYEGAPDLFERVELSTTQGETATAYLYRGRCPPDCRIASGSWRNRKV